VITGAVATDMAKVRQRKRDMVEREIELHLHNYRTSGAELIMGSGRFVAPKTLEVRRIGTPDDLGKAAVFLASDDSAYVTCSWMAARLRSE
jgi:pyruvate/2-oxoglutarate dehydrogenase complex dihydrolipoamide dehydrogenase (E3) component